MNTTRPPRTLAVCDLENLAGVDPRLVPAPTWARITNAFIQTAALQPDDLLIVAVNPGLAIEAHRAAPTARLRCRRGTNGADQALLDELADPWWVATRFDRVVIGSGDGGFTEAVVALNHTTIETTIIADHRCVSRRLRLAAQEFRPLCLTSKESHHAA